MSNSGDFLSSVSKMPFERLPTTVVPSFYDITIQPDLVNLTFTGSEIVSIQIKESVDQIVVNVDDLIINEAAYAAGDSDSNKVPGHVTIDSDNQVARIKFANTLQPGSGKLYLTFKGNLNDQMKGFYRCKYRSANGEERYSASTQFETTYARRAFPCWDEPAIKSRFQVTMIAPKDLVVLSNTDVISEMPYEKDASWKVVRFDETPIMSTYLVAFIVGEYEYIETKTDRGTSVKVYTPVGKKKQGEFALETAAKCLTFFENYFNVPYPLPKIDHIAIPDFAMNAMENWGLVTYREVALLADPEKSSASTREVTAIVVTHETAHHWFGNYVTMEWWTHLWLKEGFATFMSFLSTDKIHPELEVWAGFVSSCSLAAFGLDSLHNTHSIEIPVGHPGEVESIFDAISYNKGAAIIRMCYNWIGDEQFKQGLQKYLTKHAYKNAVTEDLWRALEDVSKKPVEKMMSTWTKQRGHPIVQVSCRTEGNKRILMLTQERFTIDGVLDDEEKNMLWHIPVAVVTSRDPKNPVVSTLMETKTMEIPLENLAPTDWVKINPEVIGFYCVSYTADMLELLKPAIQTKQIGPIDRLQIVNDLFSTSLAGKASTVDFLRLLSFYNHEDEYIAWDAIDASIGKLNLLLSYTDYQPLLHAFGRKLYANVYAKLGFDPLPDNKHTDNLLRTLVLGRLVSFGDENVIAEAKKRFADHCNGKLIAPDIRGVVYRAVARYGDENEFNKIFELYDKDDQHEEKVRLALSAASALDAQRVKRVLDFSFSNKVRIQDSWKIISATVESKEGRELAWNFYCKNIDEIKRRYGTHKSSAKLIENVTSCFASKDKHSDVQLFFSTRTFSGLESYILRGLESIRNNMEWLSRESQSVQQFLQS